MTLILTALTRRSVVQVADMRLTDAWTGAVRHESTAKMVRHAGPFVVSFAGAAHLGDQPTSDWIADRLAGGRVLAEVFERFADDADEIISTYPRPFRRLAIVGGGWLGPDQARPVYLEVTNFDFDTGALLAGFRTVVTPLERNEKARVFSAGVAVPSERLRGVEDLMQRRAGRQSERQEDLAAPLVRLARSVAFGERTVGMRLLVGSVAAPPRSLAPSLIG